MERQFYTVIEVAEMLGISRATAYRAIADGEIPSITIRGRVLVPKWWVDQLLQPVKEAQ